MSGWAPGDLSGAGKEAPSPTAFSGIHGPHVGPKNGIHSGLVSWALSSEPLKNIPVNTERDGFLQRRRHDHGIVPEVIWEVSQLRGGSTGDLGLAHSSEAIQIRPSLRGGINLRPFSGTLSAHACCSFWQK